MCEHVRTAIEVIQAQPRKTLTKGETLMLFQQVIGDNEKIGGRMTALENTVQDVKAEVADIKSDVKMIKKLLEDMKKEKKKGLFDKLKEMNRYFWITIWIVLLGIFSWMGVQFNIAGIGDILRGGQ